MKVADLKVGMMLIPKVNRWTQKRSFFIESQTTLRRYYKDRTGEFDSFLGIACRVTPRPYSHHSGCKHRFGVYMGSEKSEFEFDGVKTHHFILLGSTLTRITGYDFRYIEPLSEKIENL